MPAITFTSNGFVARDLYGLTVLLKGDDVQFAARAKLREKILKVWPEFDGDNPEERPEEADLTKEEKTIAAMKRAQTEERGIVITPDQQTALYEGFLKRLKDGDVDDAAKETILALAKRCRCRGALDKHLTKGSLREFAESDEAPELDPEPAPKAAPEPAA